MWKLCKCSCWLIIEVICWNIAYNSCPAIGDTGVISVRYQLSLCWPLNNSIGQGSKTYDKLFHAFVSRGLRLEDTALFAQVDCLSSLMCCKKIHYGNEAYSKIQIIITIIIRSTAQGGSWPPQANVASDLYPGHPPANFYKLAGVFLYPVNPSWFRSVTSSLTSRVCP